MTKEDFFNLAEDFKKVMESKTIYKNGVPVVIHSGDFNHDFDLTKIEDATATKSIEVKHAYNAVKILAWLYKDVEESDLLKQLQRASEDIYDGEPLYLNYFKTSRLPQ